MRRLKVVFERDQGGVWTVSVPRIRGCHTYGRTLAQARERIREALRLFDAHDPQLAEQIRLPRGALESVRRARRARQRAETSQRQAQEQLRTAAAQLARAGLSRRDAGDLLGLSRQRVQQLRSA